MADFPTTAPTIASAGVIDTEVDAEVEVPPVVVPPTPPTMTAANVRKLIKWASIYGKTRDQVRSDTKWANYGGKSIENMSRQLGLWPSQVRSVLDEFNAWVGRPPVVEPPPQEPPV